jgi:hypothetical protein
VRLLYFRAFRVVQSAVARRIESKGHQKHAKDGQEQGTEKDIARGQPPSAQGAAAIVSIGIFAAKPRGRSGLSICVSRTQTLARDALRLNDEGIFHVARYARLD